MVLLSGELWSYILGRWGSKYSENGNEALILKVDIALCWWFSAKFWVLWDCRIFKTFRVDKSCQFELGNGFRALEVWKVRSVDRNFEGISKNFLTLWKWLKNKLKCQKYFENFLKRKSSGLFHPTSPPSLRSCK